MKHGATLKARFIEAIQTGELGHIEDQGIIITMQEFKAYFDDVKTQYVTSFLPAATLEPGQITMSHTKFVFRLRKGVYRIHQDALN